MLAGTVCRRLCFRSGGARDAALRDGLARGFGLLAGEPGCVRRVGGLLTWPCDVSRRSTQVKTFARDDSLGRNERLGLSRPGLRKRSANILQDLDATKQKLKLRVGLKENIWTVPNLLCISRIVVTPYMGYLIVSGDCRFALYLLAFAGFTDWLDGFIARRFKSQSSKFGSFLDPMADKILMGTLFVTLTYAELMPLALTAVIVCRDALLLASGFYIRYLSLPKPITLALYLDATHATAQLRPTLVSKLNTTVQLCAAAVTLASPVFDFHHHPYLLYLWWFTGFSTVVSGLSYVISKDTYRILKAAKKRKINN